MPDKSGPTSLSDLFWSLTWLSLQGFGGVLAVVQQELVERKRWMTSDEFIEDWAVAQILPGPNVVNIAIMIGSRHFGFAGALTAVAGMLCIPLALLLMLTIAYLQFSELPAVAGALRGMGAVAAGLIIGTGLKMLPSLRVNVLGRRWCGVFALACFVGVGLLRWPLLSMLVAFGGTACTLAYRRIAR